MGTADNTDWLLCEPVTVAEWIFFGTGARWPYWLALAAAFALPWVLL